MTKHDNVPVVRELGSNMVDMVSKLVTTNVPTAIIELIANSYDADATNVYVTCDLERSFLEIRDTGSGMTPTDLKSFYLLGDSPKLEQPVSPRDRRRIGKFGVATILLEALCGNYELVTRKDGLETRVKETFTGRHSARKKIPKKTVECNKAEHGTVITARSLTFIDSETFKISELVRKIRWELPILPDFQVYVNAKKIEPLSFTNAQKFKVDDTKRSMGHVHGTIYFANKKTKMAGIHVYVNGRRIGDPKLLLGIIDKPSITGRCVGIIHANGLEKAILFDRGKFRDDHPAFTQLRKTVRDALNQVRQHGEKSALINRSTKIKSQQPQIMKKVMKRIREAGFEDANKNTKLVFADDMPSLLPGRFDTDTNTVLLNENYSALLIHPETNAAQYEAALLHAFVDVLTLQRLGSDRVTFGTVLKERESIWRTLNITKASERLQERVHKMICYTTKEFSKLTGRSEGTLHYMIGGGVLSRQDDGILGGEYLEVEPRIKGMVSLYAFVETHYEQGNIHRFLTEAADALCELCDCAEPFVVNIGTQDHPCFFYESACAKKLENMFLSYIFGMGSSVPAAKSAFESFGSEMLTLSELAKNLAGIDMKEAAAVITYANKNSLPLKQKSREKIIRIKYSDFVAAYQHMRASKN